MPASSISLTGLLALGAVVNGYADPERCTGECYAHDPTLIQRSSDSKYFRFNTDDAVSIYSSDSLSGPWSNVGNVLPDGSSINLSDGQGLWAPDVIQKDDTYILYYSVSTLSSQNSVVAYATSTTLESGSWTDHGSTGVESSDGDDYNAIDPTVVLESGTYYMTFGSYWNGVYNVALNDDATSVADLSSATQAIYKPSGNHNAEAGFPYKRNGYWYMFFSEGQANRYATDKPADGDEYKVRVCRSESIDGAYVDSSGTSCTEGGGNYVLESHGEVYGPGAQGIFDDPTYGVIMYYRYVNTSIGYEVADYQWGWNVLTWTDGWPTV